MRGDPPPRGKADPATETSTPHARGSTQTAMSGKGGYTVYPACAGIHPRRELESETKERLPRMRGDPPPEPGEPRTGESSTPHARGSTSVS